MKTLTTIILTILTTLVFGQGDIKFDIIMKTIPSDPIFTKVVDYDKPDTCYIHVITNDTSAIEVLKSTYLLDRYEVKGPRYTFYFPKKSSARIMTNLEGAKVRYSVDKVIRY